MLTGEQEDWDRQTDRTVRLTNNAVERHNRKDGMKGRYRKSEGEGIKEEGRRDK